MVGLDELINAVGVHFGVFFYAFFSLFALPLPLACCFFFFFLVNTWG